MLKLKNKREIIYTLSLLTQIGLTMLVPIFGCILFGSFLDRKLETAPLFLAIFTIIGVMSSFRTLYIMVSKQWKDKD